MKDQQQNSLITMRAEEPGVGTCLISSKTTYPVGGGKPVITPIYQASTYEAKSCDGFGDQLVNGLVYCRLGSPNSAEVEHVLAKLEGGVGALVYGSGMAAISSTFMCFFRPGDHIIAQSPNYSGTHTLLTKYLPSYGVEVTTVPISETMIDDFRRATKSNTKMYMVETPCNPNMHIVDLEELGKLGQEMDVITAVDSTFASPINLLPLSYGIDISLHSCTKYMGGHSDLLAGCAIFKHKQHYESMGAYRTFFMSPLDPANSVLLLRSLRTLHVRVQRHNENAMAVAQYLEHHPLVHKVIYPGLPSHPQHKLAKRLMKGFGGMISIVLNTERAAKTMVENTKIFHFAVSLGGVESLIEHVPSMTHGNWAMSEEERDSMNIDKALVRLSVGLEDCNDIIGDLKQALTIAADGDKIVE